MKGPTVLSPTITHENYFPVCKRDGRTGQSSNKGKTTDFQLVLILVCLPVYVCAHMQEGWCSCVEFYSVDFFPPVDSIKCLLVLVPAACLF